MTDKLADGPVRLEGVAETLLIPLAARALAPRLNPDLNFADPVAEALFAALELDPKRFADDKASMRGSVLRTQWFDRVARTFVDRHPDALCVAMGAGLDCRAARTDIGRHPGIRWIDIDTAEVVDLRCRFLPPVDNAESRVADLNGDTWLDELPWQEGRPVLFTAEGVMMYLTPDGADRFFRGLSAAGDRWHAPIDLAFDYASPWMVRNSGRHPSVKKTQARFQWALGQPADLRAIDAELTVVEEADITSGAGLVPSLMGRVHRLLTGRTIYGCVHVERRHDA